MEDEGVVIRRCIDILVLTTVCERERYRMTSTREDRALLFYTTCDALGNPTGFQLRAGQAHDLKGADVLLVGIEAEALLADRS